MDISVFLIALFALQMICLYVGGKASKNMTTQDDYFLAGRTVGFFPLMMTLLATQIGGGVVMGAAEEASIYGWKVILYPLGQSLGFVVLAMGIGRRLAQLNVPTIAQLFEVIYRSVFLKKVASVLSMVSLFLIFAAQVIASKKFMTGLGFDQNWIFIGFWAIVIIYTVVGGMKAVIATDIIQALFFMIVFVTAFGYALLFSPIPFSEIYQTGMASSVESVGNSKLCGWLLLPLLFMVIEQDMAQRCFSAKNARLVTWASAGAAVCTFLVCLVPLFFGVLAKTAGLQSQPGSSVLMTIIQTSTTPAISALMGVAIIAAIISTADALINAISSNLTQDFELPWFNRERSVLYSRGFTCVIALAGIFVSFFFDNVVDLLILSYELSVSCLFVPVFAALVKKRGNQLSAILSIAMGAIAFFLLRAYPMVIPKEILSLVLSLAGFVVGEIIASRKELSQAKV